MNCMVQFTVSELLQLVLEVDKNCRDCLLEDKLIFNYIYILLVVISQKGCLEELNM